MICYFSTKLYNLIIFFLFFVFIFTIISFACSFALNLSLYSAAMRRDWDCLIISLVDDMWI